MLAQIFGQAIYCFLFNSVGANYFNLYDRVTAPNQKVGIKIMDGMRHKQIITKVPEGYNPLHALCGAEDKSGLGVYLVRDWKEVTCKKCLKELPKK